MGKRMFYRSKRVRLRIRMVALCLAAAIFFLYMVIKCRPILTAFSESEAVWIATQVANKTIADILKQNADASKGMVQVSYDDNGQLTAVIPNTASINALRTAITDAAMLEMASLDTLSIRIPIGTMLGFDWLSGWGPTVSFPISFTATVLSDVSSTLEAVGMNQSMYRVLIHLDISLYVVSPGGRSSVGTQMSYPMAETVLLGKVPDNLTEVYGDDQSILGKIFDYGTAE